MNTMQEVTKKKLERHNCTTRTAARSRYRQPVDRTALRVFVVAVQRVGLKKHLGQMICMIYSHLMT